MAFSCFFFDLPLCLQCAACLDIRWTHCKANLGLTSVCLEGSGCSGVRVHVAVCVCQPDTQSK